MADLSDVSNALGALIGLILYPAGASGENPSPVVGVPVRIEVGWPSPQSLDAAIKAGKSHISIYPRSGERNTSRFASDWQDLSTVNSSYTLGVAGQAITVGGAVQTPPYSAQNLVALIGGKPYLVQSVGGETTAGLASTLGALIAADLPGTTIVGSVITLPAGARITAVMVGTTGQGINEIGRQEREFQITIWSPNPADRDAIAKAIDPALRLANILTLADGSGANSTYKGSPFNDFDQKQGIFRRDLIYAVDYGTTQMQSETQIVETQLGIAPGSSGGVPIGTVRTIFN